MYKQVTGLRQEELDELKNKIMIDRDDDYGEFLFILGTEGDKVREGLSGLTREEWEIIDNATHEEHIPNELIYKIYKDTNFIDEDFWCNI